MIQSKHDYSHNSTRNDVYIRVYMESDP